MSEPKQKPGRSKQDYGTPPEFLAAVKGLLGIEEFDCDIAASHKNNVAADYFNPLDSAFDAPSWKRGDGWNWLNPPFTKIEPWARRAWEEYDAPYSARTAMLIPAAVGSNWWRDWVHNKAQVLFVNPRLTFVGCKDPFPKDCALLLYGRSPYHSDYYNTWRWKLFMPVGAVDPVGESVTDGPRARKDSSIV